MTTSDHAEVLGRPPVLYGASLISGLALQMVWPIEIVNGASTAWTSVFLFLPVGLIAWGRCTLLKAKTAVDPALPSTRIVSSGPFHFSRNPLYVGLTLIYANLTVVANSWWGVILLFPLLILMHYGVVCREERYLERKFGDRYLRYRATVPRY